MRLKALLAANTQKNMMFQRLFVEKAQISIYFAKKLALKSTLRFTVWL